MDIEIKSLNLAEIILAIYANICYNTNINLAIHPNVGAISRYIYPAMLIVQYTGTPSGVLSCCAFGVAFFVANISSKVAYTIRYFTGVLFHTAWLTASRR